MYPDRLSLPAISNESSGAARSSSRTDGDASFSALYEEALQSAGQAISELGSPDPADADASPVDDLLNLLDARAALLDSSCGPALMGSGASGWLTAELAQSAAGNAVNRADWKARFAGGTGNFAIEPAADAQTSPSGVGRLIAWLDSHAHLHSIHRCAASVREAMEAAGISTADRPASGDAGDYGPFLLRHGAQVIPADHYQPRPGDIAVYDKSEEHPAGHVQVFDGRHWVSDFVQHAFSPYSDPGSAPSVTVYRMS